MARFRLVTHIAAPIDVCFDLARDIDFHTRSLEGTSERAVASHCSRPTRVQVFAKRELEQRRVA